MSFDYVKHTCFFNNKDKIEINLTKNSCATHILIIKKRARVIFIVVLEEVSPNQFKREHCPYTTQKREHIYK